MTKQKQEKIEKLELVNSNYLIKEMWETDLQILVNKINQIIDVLNKQGKKE